jgi:hypothetical protein
MLAPLGFFLLNMVITCTMVLLICWAHDNNTAKIEPRQSRPADLGFVDDSISGDWRPYFDSIFDSMDDLGLGVENRHAA